MKTFKLLSSLTNKIGNLTNRNIFNNSNNNNNNKGYTIDEYEQDIEKIKCLLESLKFQNNIDKNNPSIKKNLDKLEKYLSRILKFLFDLNVFNQNSFKLLIESKILPILAENINILYISTISNIIMPYINKLIFIDNKILFNGKLKEEAIIINTQIVGCVKKTITEFKNILNKVNIININSDLYFFIINGILPFLNNLFDKLIKYPNFYYALVNDSTTININLDLLLYEILLNLLKFEHQIKDRTSRSLIRRNLLRFLNNFNFPNKKELMKKIINFLISNLIEYYQNFLLLSIKKNR